MHRIYMKPALSVTQAAARLQQLPAWQQLPAHLHPLVHEVVDESQGSMELRHFDRSMCARLAALVCKEAELALTLLADRSAWLDGDELLAELEDAL